MIDSSIRAIIFDFGGVLINLNYELTISRFKGLGIQNFENLYSQASQSGLFDAIEVGAISPEEFIEGLKQFLPNTTGKAIVEAWNAMLLDVPDQSIELLKSLRQKGYKLYMLSNTNAIHIEEALIRWKTTSNEMPVELMDHVFLSHEIGMRKPDVNTFEYVCSKIGLKPSECLFIDDSIQHIEGANKVGLQTIHLENISDLPNYFS